MQQGSKNIATTEKIPLKEFQKLIREYLYTQRLPQDQVIVDLIPEQDQPHILERKGVIDRIKG